MTAREIAVARDLVARASVTLGKVNPLVTVDDLLDDDRITRMLAEAMRRAMEHK